MEVEEEGGGGCGPSSGYKFPPFGKDRRGDEAGEDGRSTVGSRESRGEGRRRHLWSTSGRTGRTRF